MKDARTESEQKLEHEIFIKVIEHRLDQILTVLDVLQEYVGHSEELNALSLLATAVTQLDELECDVSNLEDKIETMGENVEEVMDIVQTFVRAIRKASEEVS